MSSPEIRVDVVAFGELVIDLIPAGRDGDDPLYAARPGGAPGNVAAGVARLGLRAAMLTKVGREAFGDLALSALSRLGVDVSSVRRADTENTTLACVSLDEAGDRTFAFYRAAAADTIYAPDEIDDDLIAGSWALHVGALSLKTPVSAAAQRHAVAVAQGAGCLVSADPNLRPGVWDDPAAMLAASREAVGSADIVKVSAEELAMLTGTDEPAEGVRRLWHQRLKVLAVTDGARGATLYTPAATVAIDGFAVEVVDTVGCGDAFMASLLAGLLTHGMDTTALGTLGRRACAAGAIIATRPGAMTRMPRVDEIDAFLSNR